VTRRETPGPPDEDSDLRCLCGGLMARWKNGRLELKCRRCKRTVAIPYDRGAEFRTLARWSPLEEA
jgi:phage FluMu protein Com